MRHLIILSVPVVVIAVAFALWPPVSSAEAGLRLNGTPHRGTHTLRTGFTPDPWAFPLTAGGGRTPVDISTLNIAGCPRGFVTRSPDFRFNFAAGSSFNLLRFYVESGADALLLINEPNGSYRCNDDHGRSGWGSPLMPAVDYRNPPAGRYDIWVGTFNRTSNQPATLNITELDSNHP